MIESFKANTISLCPNSPSLLCSGISFSLKSENDFCTLFIASNVIISSNFVLARKWSNSSIWLTEYFSTSSSNCLSLRARRLVSLSSLPVDFTSVSENITSSSAPFNFSILSMISSVSSVRSSSSYLSNALGMNFFAYSSIYCFNASSLSSCLRRNSMQKFVSPTENTKFSQRYETSFNIKRVSE